MRISDWSSDVCSSDLQHHAITLVAQRLAGLRARVVELAGLADDDRAGADDEDGLEVAALGHCLVFRGRSGVQGVCAVACLPPMCLSKKASIFVYRFTLLSMSRKPCASFFSTTLCSGFLPTAAIRSTSSCMCLIGTRSSFAPCTSMIAALILSTP